MYGISRLPRTSHLSRIQSPILRVVEAGAIFGFSDILIVLPGDVLEIVVISCYLFAILAMKFFDLSPQSRESAKNDTCLSPSQMPEARGEVYHEM